MFCLYNNFYMKYIVICFSESNRQLVGVSFMRRLEKSSTTRQLCFAGELLGAGVHQLTRELTSQVSEGSSNSILAFILNAYCS